MEGTVARQVPVSLSSSASNPCWQPEESNGNSLTAMDPRGQRMLMGSD